MVMFALNCALMITVVSLMHYVFNIVRASQSAVISWICLCLAPVAQCIVLRCIHVIVCIRGVSFFTAE